MRRLTDASLPCIIVAGQGRCGTSLTMQMLDAAGVPCVGSFPAYETDASGIETFDPAHLAGLRGNAIKLIDPANLRVGDMPNHLVIWLDRNFREQAKSIAKFTGGGINRSGMRILERSLRNDRERHRAVIGVPGGAPFLTLRFEDLIERPHMAAVSIASFLNEHGWSVEEGDMLDAFIPRPASCLPGFLEPYLIERAALQADTPEGT